MEELENLKKAIAEDYKNLEVLPIDYIRIYISKHKENNKIKADIYCLHKHDWGRDFISLVNNEVFELILSDAGETIDMIIQDDLKILERPVSDYYITDIKNLPPKQFYHYNELEIEELRQNFDYLKTNLENYYFGNIIKAVYDFGKSYKNIKTYNSRDFENMNFIANALSAKSINRYSKEGKNIESINFTYKKIKFNIVY